MNQIYVMPSYTSRPYIKKAKTLFIGCACIIKCHEFLPPQEGKFTCRCGFVLGSGQYLSRDGDKINDTTFSGILAQ